jgi:hypothetical protein
VSTVHYLASWGDGYDAGYRSGRADALGAGVAGLLEEIERYRKALAIIGRKGKPLPPAVTKQVARDALGQSGARRERRAWNQTQTRRSRREAA